MDPRDNTAPVKAIRAFLKLSAVVAPPLFNRVAGKLFFYPDKPALRASDKAILDAATRLDTPDNLAAWQIGDKQQPAVILTGGWSLRGIHMSAYIEPLREKGYRVIIVDMPGHGESAGDFTHPPHSEAILHPWLQTLDNLYGVIGHSYGGVLMLRAAYAGVVKLEKYAGVAVPQRYIYPEFKAYLHFSERADRLFRDYANEFVGGDILSFDCLNPPIGFATDVLFIRAEDDVVATADQQQRMAGLMPKARCVELAKGGHIKVMWDAEAVRTTMAHFPQQT